MDTKKITSRQLILTMVAFRLTMVISYMPVINFPPANQDVWIMLLFSIFYTISLRIPVLFLANKFKNSNLIEYLEIVLGKFVGKFIGLVYGFFFIFNSIYINILQAELVGAAILTNTPYWMTTIPIIFIIIYIASKGLKIILWSADLITPIILGALVLLMLLGLGNIDYREIFPVLSDSSFKDINHGAFMVSSILTEILILAMAVPLLENKDDINRIYFKGIVYSHGLMIMAVVLTQMVLGVEQTRHSNYPFLIYTRLIVLEDILERIDPIYVVAWLTLNVLGLATNVYLSYMSFKIVFNQRNPRYILYIISTIVGLISLFMSNRGMMIMENTRLTNIHMYLSFIVVSIIPFIVMLVYFFRRKALDNKIKEAGK